jgi:alkylresorcinol/alkylpyrone synthase
MPFHPVIRSVGRALPEHEAEQEEVIAALRGLWVGRHHNVERLADLHRATRVRRRNLALPITEYPKLDSFGQCNDLWIEHATELGVRAIADGLERAGLEPRDVDHLYMATTTGVSGPSIDATLVNRLGMRLDVRRSPIFGLGCAGGVGALTRAADVLRGRPGEVAVVLAVELCSLTLQRDDLSIANVIAAGLFGDGAAAVVLAGAGEGPRVTAARSILYPQTEKVMGWEVVDSGFRVVLAAEVPKLIREHLGDDVDNFLAACGLAHDRIDHWLPHPGGPKVLEAIQDALGLDAEDVAVSWRSMESHGNLSSASALFVLGEHLDRGVALPGDIALLAAMGPGFSAELALLEWS